MIRASVLCLAAMGLVLGVACAQDANLPGNVKAVWDMSKAYRESTSTSERVCINGLWKWQPASEIKDVPAGSWGYMKAPGAWGDGTQVSYSAPGWKGSAQGATMGWYQREITIPPTWAGRRIAVYAEYLNSYAAVYVDGKKMGEMTFPGGEVDITAGCTAGQKHMLSMGVKALPLSDTIALFNDTNAVTQAKASVALRGLCGDVYLESAPKGARVDDVMVQTSVRNWAATFNVALAQLDPAKSYTMRAQIMDAGKPVTSFTSQAVKAADLKDGRVSFTAKWHPDKLWDITTPKNTYTLELSLLDASGKTVDAFHPVRFGFREFWTKGRDFYLNGSRITCFAEPIDNAQEGAACASYEGCKETLTRMKSYGVYLVYTHNYGSQPGAHLGFEGLMRAADEVGMLVAISMPHYGHYKWDGADAGKTNGYERHAGFYAHMVGNHPSVVMYATNHNGMAYAGCFDPDVMDGKHNESGGLGPRTDAKAKEGLTNQAIIEHLDPTRVVYHHHSGALGGMYTLNLYLDFVPIQERSDYFEHWAAEGVVPLFLVEYGVPWDINWTTYRGWYNGTRAWGSAKAPYEFTEGEWNSQFLGDRGFELNDKDKANLVFEAKKWRAGDTWFKWDYPYQPSWYHSWGHPNQDEVWAMYITDNWRAYRTWGMSAWTAWGWNDYWEQRPGATYKEPVVNWDDLQKPDFSADRVERRSPKFDTDYEAKDWIPTAAAKALQRANAPLLAYIAGSATHFTAKEHNYLPGQTVAKQLIIINNSRANQTCECSWSLALPTPVGGSKTVAVESGEQNRIPLNFTLPADLKAGAYFLSITVKSGAGTQEDKFAINVTAPAPKPKAAARIAVFDPKGETTKLLASMGVNAKPVTADADLAGYDVFVVGKGALTVDGAAPSIARVADGLKVVMFEQTADVLEKRFGFRTAEYGLRNVFARVPDHPMLAGLTNDNLHDWHGTATILAQRLTGFTNKPRLGPCLDWCGISLPRAYRAGNWGNVGSVLIEKPACGNFLPIVDGGYSLEYSPLLEYREGKGVMVLCQMDVTGRTDGTGKSMDDPAAARIVSNILGYVSSYSAPAPKQVFYVGNDSGLAHLKEMGLKVNGYQGGALPASAVLVAGPGAPASLDGAKADAVREWVKKGGSVLAIGLSQTEADAFLPVGVKTTSADYICAVFEPQPMQSVLAGVGAADVMNRDPRKLNLVTGGANVLGNGVLASATQGNVAFCQLIPWEFNYQKYFNQKRTFRRASFLVTRLLGNLGADEPTPMLARFAGPADKKGADKRWLTGFYLDKPEEMDDPYRYFQW